MIFSEQMLKMLKWKLVVARGNKFVLLYLVHVSMQERLLAMTIQLESHCGMADWAFC